MTNTYQYSKTGTEMPRIGDPRTTWGSTEDDNVFVDRMETLTNETSQLKSVVQDRPVKSNAQLRDLGEDGYTLLEPILITLEEYPGEDTVIASLPEVEVFGEGVTESEAIYNLKLAILDLYEELTETPINELGDLPKNWLSVLQKLIQKN